MAVNLDAVHEFAQMRFSHLDESCGFTIRDGAVASTQMHGFRTGLVTTESAVRLTASFVPAYSTQSKKINAVCGNRYYVRYPPTSLYDHCEETVSDWKAGVWRVPGVRKVLTFRSMLSARSFDWRYRVRTCGEEDPSAMTVVGDNASHAGHYIPTSFRAGRHILRDLPIADVSNYTFIDLGSGKGRMLLLAAELPFRRIIGVEFASDLNALAQNNAKLYRNAKQVCFQIESVNMDATQYEFPIEPLLVYLFYPFHEMVMEPVIRNLNQSLAEHPRDVILVYHNPVLAGVVETASHLKLYARKSDFSVHYAVYRSVV